SRETRSSNLWHHPCFRPFREWRSARVRGKRPRGRASQRGQVALLVRSEEMVETRDIAARVKQVLVEALSADEDDITPHAALQRDLGAESIDMLDIVFRLEREFDIRIARDELFPESIFGGDHAFVQDGRVTDQGVIALRSRM